jgi:hypothetical protein
MRDFEGYLGHQIIRDLDDPAQLPIVSARSITFRTRTRDVACVRATKTVCREATSGDGTRATPAVRRLIS